MEGIYWFVVGTKRTKKDPKYPSSTLYRVKKLLFQNPNLTDLKKKGRPFTLSTDKEEIILNRLHSLRLILSHITNDIIVRESVYVLQYMFQVC